MNRGLFVAHEDSAGCRSAGRSRRRSVARRRRDSRIPCPHPDRSGPEPPFSLRSSDVSSHLSVHDVYLRSMLAECRRSVQQVVRTNRAHKKAPVGFGGAWGTFREFRHRPMRVVPTMSTSIITGRDSLLCVGDIMAAGRGRQPRKREKSCHAVRKCLHLLRRSWGQRYFPQDPRVPVGVMRSIDQGLQAHRHAISAGGRAWPGSPSSEILVSRVGARRVDGISVTVHHGLNGVRARSAMTSAPETPRASRPPITRHAPGHFLVDPDQRSLPHAQRRVVSDASMLR